VKPHGYHYCDYTFLFDYHSPTSPRIFFAAAHVEHICVQFLSETHQCVLPYVRLILAVALFLFAVCKRIVDIAVILVLMCSTETLPVLFSIHLRMQFMVQYWDSVGQTSLWPRPPVAQQRDSRTPPRRPPRSARFAVHSHIASGFLFIPILHLNFYLLPQGS